MDDVAALTEANLAARHAEADAVRRIVDEELVRFAGIVSAREVAPVVTALREQAEDVRRGRAGAVRRPARRARRRSSATRSRR